MTYITNKYKSIKLPYSPDLLEWLWETYPYSKYYVVDTDESNKTRITY